MATLLRSIGGGVLVVDTGTRYEVYAKDASGASVPHQLLPADHPRGAVERVRRQVRRKALAAARGA